MKKCVYLLLILLPLSCFAQYKNSSKFLYGKSRSTLPYYLHFQVGVNSAITLFNNDFDNKGSATSIAFAFEKPLGYRPSIYLHFRLLGNYGQWNSDLGYASKISKSIDFSLNYKHLLFDWYGWEYCGSIGLGILSNEYAITSLSKSIQNENTSVITPIQFSTGRVIKKRWEFELGYRYYIAWDNNIEGLIHKNDYDKYAFTYVGIKYRLGEKDYRFKRSDSCPTVE